MRIIFADDRTQNSDVGPQTLKCGYRSSVPGSALGDIRIRIKEDTKKVACGRALDPDPHGSAFI